MFSFLKKERQLPTQQKGLDLKSHELAQALTHAPRGLPIQIETTNEKGESVLSTVESIRIIENSIIIKIPTPFIEKKTSEDLFTPPEDKSALLPSLPRRDTMPISYKGQTIHFDLYTSEKKIIEELSVIYPEIKLGISYLEYDGRPYMNVYALIAK